MVSVEFAEGLPKDLQRALGALALRLGSRASHTVRILVQREPVLYNEDHDVHCFGVFLWPDDRQAQEVEIQVAGGLLHQLRRGGYTRPEALEAVCHVLAHEWVHYEQWSSGREPTERGVAVRARTLLRG